MKISNKKTYHVNDLYQRKKNAKNYFPEKFVELQLISLIRCYKCYNNKN